MLSLRGLATALLLSLLGLSLTAGAVAQEAPGHTHEDQAPDPNGDPTGEDAAQIAADLGISVEAARAAIERQPEVGRLQEALEKGGGQAFGGLLIDYTPDYRVRLLAEPRRGEELRQTVHNLGFAHLEEFIQIEETPFTEAALLVAVQRVRAVTPRDLTTTDIDLREGAVRVTVATHDDVAAVRAAVAKERASISARDVIVKQGESVPTSSSYGGLHNDEFNDSSTVGSCTTGFSVRNINSGDHGVASAAHCGESNRYVHSVLLNAVAGKLGGSADAIWFQTPGMTDHNWIKYSSSGTTREITSRTDRDAMTIGGTVCKYGHFGDYDCGTIRGKNFDPDGLDTGFHDTWIRVRDAPVPGGDSGGPWFLSYSAYGMTRSTVTDGSNDSIFMAQNYLRTALNLEVRISP